IGASMDEIARVAPFHRVRGVQIGSNIDGTDVDDPSLEPVWAGVERRDVPGMPLESTIAAANLIFGGVLDRHPDLRFGFTHGGGFSPYQIGRWEHGWTVRPEPRVNITDTGPGRVV